MIEEQFESYAKGTISHYEIESMSFYYHDHELRNVNKMIYDIKDYLSQFFQKRLHVFPQKTVRKLNY